MELSKTGISGTMESSDILITIEPNKSEGIMIQLNSPVIKQFGKQIEKVIRDTLKEMDVDRAVVMAVDKGALDCVIRARVQTAVVRSVKDALFDWKGVAHR